MLGIELTTGQKVQVGVVVLVLSLAGYELWTGLRPTPDGNVASWVEPRRVGMDPGKPISDKNPADPQKSGVATLFNCFDGKLEIVEFPAESGKGTQIRFDPDKRRSSYQMYKDPLQAVITIKDGYKRALTMAAYSASLNRPLGVLNSAALSKEQLAAEKSARDLMMNEILMFDQEAREGVIAPALHEALMKALVEFRKTPGDALKDRTKGAAAKKVIAAALAYMSAVEQKRMSAINKYVASVDKLLQDGQKPKVASAGQALAGRWKNGSGTAVVSAALARS
jgi:hypothetical protein